MDTTDGQAIILTIRIRAEQATAETGGPIPMGPVGQVAKEGTRPPVTATAGRVEKVEAPAVTIKVERAELVAPLKAIPTADRVEVGVGLLMARVVPVATVALQNRVLAESAESAATEKRAVPAEMADSRRVEEVQGELVEPGRMARVAQAERAAVQLTRMEELVARGVPLTLVRVEPVALEAAPSMVAAGQVEPVVVARLHRMEKEAGKAEQAGNQRTARVDLEEWVDRAETAMATRRLAGTVV
jgi:hypothetical protein